MTIPVTSQFRVRAKNVNGWSQWSNFGFIMTSNDRKWNDDLYMWLHYHTLEQYYGKIVEYGVTSIEELMKLSSTEIGSRFASSSQHRTETEAYS